MALTPEQLAAYRKATQPGQGYYQGDTWFDTTPASYVDPATGMEIGNFNAAGVSPEQLSYSMGLNDPSGQYLTYGTGGVRGSGKLGDTYNILDMAGADTGKTGTYAGESNVFRDALLAAALMAGGAAAFGPGGMFGSGAGSAAGSAAGGMANGAFLGEGALSGIGAWDGALAAAGGAGAAGGTAAADSLLNGLNGSDIMSDAFVSNGGYGAGGFGGTSGSYLSNLANGAGNLTDRALGGTGAGTASTSASTTAAGSVLGGLGSTVGSAASSLLGNASWLAPLIGGALGSQPTTTENNVTKKMDPRMDALVYGDGGLLNNATDWFKANKSGMNDQMRSALMRNRGLLNDPATTQGFQNMATQGQGLLNRPIAQNPFTSGGTGQFGSNLLQQYFPR